MATTYNDLASAQAAYEQILAARKNAAAQKTSALRRGETNRQLALMAVRNHLAQRGLANTGAAESTILRAQGMPIDTSAYDAQLADYEGQLTGLDRIIQQFKNAQASGFVGGGIVNPTSDPIQAPAYKTGATSATEAQKVALGISPSYVPFTANTSSLTGNVRKIAQSAIGTANTAAKKNTAAKRKNTGGGNGYSSASQRNNYLNIVKK